MTKTRTGRPAKIISALALALALTLVVAGCNSKTPETTPAQTPTSKYTAKSGLDAATSAMATTAPDAKLLVVQTPSAVTPTSTAVWSYLFGNPKDDKTYMVYVAQGKAEPASEYGEAGLDEDEWAKVPNTDAWKIDSPEAYEKALKATGAKTTAGYSLGFLTYVPASETESTTRAFVWYVSFDPATSGVASGTAEVDATSGETTVR